MQQKVVILNSKDNVATSLIDLNAGQRLRLLINDEIRLIRINNDIPYGHKFSISEIQVNKPIIKYGEVIGVAIKKICPGDHVHIHNVASTRGRGDLSQDKH